MALDNSFVDPGNHYRSVRLEIAQMCFIVGFPEGLFTVDGTTILPVWRTGHIASEPAIYHEGLPQLLVDAATCEGMSGSPVYVCASGGGSGNRLVGIYAGRTSRLSDIGRAFTVEAITKMIATGRVSGPVPYPPKSSS